MTENTIVIHPKKGKGVVRRFYGELKVFYCNLSLPSVLLSEEIKEGITIKRKPSNIEECLDDFILINGKYPDTIIMWEVPEGVPRRIKNTIIKEDRNLEEGLIVMLNDDVNHPKIRFK